MKKRFAWRRCLCMAIPLLAALVSFSQNNVRVTGQVKDETGKPLEGVTVSVKGSTTAMATKADGNFEITAPSETSTLIFSSVGFTEQEVPCLWPIATNTDNGNGQDGNGKGQMKRTYTFRPWPSAYLIQLTDENGRPLDAAAQAAYQNPGY